MKDCPCPDMNEIKEWELNCLAEYGWYMHMVPAGDDQTATGVNAHTHGLDVYEHLDFQIVLPVPPEVIHHYLTALANRVKLDEKFTLGDYQLEHMQVRLISATECERPVLRVVFPDRNGALDKDQMEQEAFRFQYGGCNGCE